MDRSVGEGGREGGRGIVCSLYLLGSNSAVRRGAVGFRSRNRVALEIDAARGRAVDRDFWISKYIYIYILGNKYIYMIMKS